MKTKLSLIVTIYNEENTILRFIKSVLSQSKLPDEFIIVDGGSSDSTVKIVKDYLLKNKVRNPTIKLLNKPGNRSVGRNEGIRKATGDIILCSDAGNTLDKNWVKNIIKPFSDTTVDVVAGYYKGNSETFFQKCVIPYALVMPDRIVESEFLPAARSVAFKKSIWKKIHGFDEEYSHNEDYVFANNLKRANSKIVFVKDAIVYWTPRKNIWQAFVMFFRFALGDAESGIVRDKVILIYVRYIFYAYLIVIALLLKSIIILMLILIATVVYVLWAVKKNYKYVEDLRAFTILPLLQITSDLAVLIGTSLGLTRLIMKVNLKSVVKGNSVLFILVTIYIITMISVITSGIPNQYHPFAYQMDEWHQMQAVRDVFKYGTPNLSGSANGTMFNFFISGILLIPFYITHIVNPFAIKSSVDSIFEQEKLFIVLRLLTLFFGVLTLITMRQIAKLLKINSILILLLFIFTPAWLVISNFFKYDIALTFWVALSFYYFLKFSLTPNKKNFLLACTFSGFSFAVKVSAIPLLILVPVSYLMFMASSSKKYLSLALGVFIFFVVSVFFGLPDVVFRGQSMFEYIYSNIVSGPSLLLRNFPSKYSLTDLTLLHKLPAIFGHELYFVSIPLILYFAYLIFKDFKQKRTEDLKQKLFILLSFLVFCLSYVPLGITISANRSVVLLPFLVTIDALALKNMIESTYKTKFLKIFFYIFLVILMFIQIFESYLWVGMKLSPSPEQTSSAWIVNNIPEKSVIGLENIPIYQFEPDFVLKEFYEKQYHPNFKTRYNYVVIDSKTKVLPKYVVISNVQYEKMFYKISLKSDLVKKLQRIGYFRVAYFPLKLPLYKYFDSFFYYPYLGLFVYPDGIGVYEKR